MRAYIFRRLAWLPLILLITTFITFMLGRFGPGDPVEILMGQHADPEVVERIREQRGLNDNVLLQYGRYLWEVSPLPLSLKSDFPFIQASFDFGESYKYRGRTVGELLWKKMWISGQLNIAALTISVSLGVPIGLFAALKQGTFWDTSAVVTTLIAQSLPVFLTAPTLLLIFALKLGVLPTNGWEECHLQAFGWNVCGSISEFIGAPFGLFHPQIILPAVAMGVPGIAIMARLTRASTLDVISQDYIRTARAKGLQERTVRSRHILRNSLIPVVTTLGFSLAGLVFTSFIVERFFGIPGVGSLFIEAIFARDYPVINTIIIIGTTMFVLANLVVDLIYPLLDPRIRLGGSHVAG